MSSTTFYIPPEQITGDSAVMTGDELRHARLTLRLGNGDAVRIVDGEGSSWNALVQSMGKSEGTLTISERKVEPAPVFKLTIAMGIVPGERYDWAIQKGTELGASAFIPLITKRTELKSKGNWKRLGRLKRIIISACKQSGRTLFPAISEPVRLEDLDTESYDLSVVFWEESAVKSLKEMAEGIAPPERCLMIIGPVGGLTVEEVELLKEKGCTVAGMGPRILRTETAVAAGTALMQYLWGDMG